MATYESHGVVVYGFIECNIISICVARTVPFCQAGASELWFTVLINSTSLPSVSLGQCPFGKPVRESNARFNSATRRAIYGRHSQNHVVQNFAQSIGEAVFNACTFFRQHARICLAKKFAEPFVTWHLVCREDGDNVSVLGDVQVRVDSNGAARSM